MHGRLGLGLVSGSAGPGLGLESGRHYGLKGGFVLSPPSSLQDSAPPIPHNKQDGEASEEMERAGQMCCFITCWVLSARQ